MVALTIYDRTIVILEVGSSGRSVSLVERGRLSWRSLHDRVCLPGAEPASPNRLSDSTHAPCRQAARKNATLRGTCASISASSVLRFTSNSARSSMGTRTRSRKSRAVVARRSSKSIRDGVIAHFIASALTRSGLVHALEYVPCGQLPKTFLRPSFAFRYCASLRVVLLRDLFSRCLFLRMFFDRLNGCFRHLPR